MDTPGVRGFGIFDAEDGMEEMFGDLEELFGQCRFSDCAHGREPGCAVQAALADGVLDDRRWASYLKLQRELAALARRHDAAARRAYQREWHQKIAVAGKSQRSAERDSHENAPGHGSGKRQRQERPRQWQERFQGQPAPLPLTQPRPAGAVRVVRRKFSGAPPIRNRCASEALREPRRR